MGRVAHSVRNPSIRSALFAPLEGLDDPAIGSIVETAIFAQWFHASGVELHYARWRDGEVDIVSVGPDQRPDFAVEVKFTDRFFESPRKLLSLLAFARDNGLPRVFVTSRTAHGKKTVDGIQIEFLPAAVYCLILGRDVVRGAGRRGPGRG